MQIDRFECEDLVKLRIAGIDQVEDIEYQSNVILYDMYVELFLENFCSRRLVRLRLAVFDVR